MRIVRKEEDLPKLLALKLAKKALEYDMFIEKYIEDYKHIEIMLDNRNIVHLMKEIVQFRRHQSYRNKFSS